MLLASSLLLTTVLFPETATPAPPPDPLPSYTCVVTDLSPDGTLTGTHCQPSNGAPAGGAISQPFAVWSPPTTILTCTAGQADTPAGITASGCRRVL